MTNPQNASFKAYACVCGLQDYQIAYASQAAEMERRIGVFIKLKDNPRRYCRAHILHKNLFHTEQKLYIAFDEKSNYYFQLHFVPQMKDGRIKLNVHVIFQLKASYFRHLQMSVEYLPSDVISRIQPNYGCKFSLNTSTGDVRERSRYGNLDAEQDAALSLILASTPPESPPILISGPFGTGKTRIMAIAANILFQERSSSILVCTQQRESADKFLLMYREVVSRSGSHDSGVKKIILRDYGKQHPNLRKLNIYVEPDKLPEHFPYSEGSLLLVTTCLTAHHLAKVSVEFTHIFIDEGAQMREPEAVAALRMANKNSTIVIAGDPQQVLI